MKRGKMLEVSMVRSHRWLPHKPVFFLLLSFFFLLFLACAVFIALTYLVDITDNHISLSL
jgi:hypothetical protein